MNAIKRRFFSDCIWLAVFGALFFLYLYAVGYIDYKSYWANCPVGFHEGCLYGTEIYGIPFNFRSDTLNTGLLIFPLIFLSVFKLIRKNSPLGETLRAGFRIAFLFGSILLCMMFYICLQSLHNMQINLLSNPSLFAFNLAPTILFIPSPFLYAAIALHKETTEATKSVKTSSLPIRILLLFLLYAVYLYFLFLLLGYSFISTSWIS